MEAAEMVVVQTMQVEGLAAAREEIVSAVQAMGWAEAEAVVMEVVQTVIMEATEALGPWDRGQIGFGRFRWRSWREHIRLW